MLTTRLKTIIFASVLLMIIHGMEEIHQGFFESYELFANVSRMFSSKGEALFIGFQITWWIMLLLFCVLLISEKWRFRVVLLFGLVLLYENQHIYQAVVEQKYYPGLISALFMIPLTIAFWREVYVSFRYAKETKSLKDDADVLEKNVVR
jgi:hypothetical protein